MPVKIRRLPSGLYRVSTPGGVKARATTYQRAHAQRRVLEAAENPDKGMAPAVYAFTYQAMTIGDKHFPETRYFNLTADIPGHVKGSTLSERTLLKYGYSLPATSHENMASTRGKLVVLDFRNRPSVSRAEVAEEALFRLTGQRESAQRVGKGHILWGNLLDIAHVASVADGIYVAGLRPFTPQESRQVARNYITVHRLRKPHPNMSNRDMIADSPRSSSVPIDDILAKVPPVYALNYLTYSGVRGVHRLTPAIAVQMFPAGGYTNVNFKHWGFDTYDVHLTFPGLRDLPVSIEELEITGVNYQILVLGQDGGPSISAHYNHEFRTPICLGLNGLYAYHKIFKFYAALEHLPKLPKDWQYMQFIG